MKRALLISFILVFLISVTVVSHASESLPAFSVDGKDIQFSESTGFPYLSNSGRTMMPLRICLESIGCEIDWNQQTQTVRSSKGSISVEIPVGKKEIQVNHSPVKIDMAAVLINGRTYLPLRAVLEAYGYTVGWDDKARTVTASAGNSGSPVTNPSQQFSPYNINGGTTGIFSRKQLGFDGFDGVQADVTLPTVTIGEKGDCPYVYFGFDWKNDVGNAEGGFQFIEDQKNPSYNKWTVFLRQGNDWRWGKNVILEQGSTHNLKFFIDTVSETQVDLVIELDGNEIIRKASSVTDFRSASAKAVTAMAMSKPFDGENCFSRSENAKITNLTVSKLGSDQYLDFSNYQLYSEWKPSAGKKGMWFGTADCIPSYLHFSTDGFLSIYKED